MHWQYYNNTVPVKRREIPDNAISRGFQNFSNLPLSHLTACQPVCQPACQTAGRPTSTRSMAPDFSHNKGNCVQFTKLLFQ